VSGANERLRNILTTEQSDHFVANSPLWKLGLYFPIAIINAFIQQSRQTSRFLTTY